MSASLRQPAVRAAEKGLGLPHDVLDDLGGGLLLLHHPGDLTGQVAPGSVVVSGGGGGYGSGGGGKKDDSSGYTREDVTAAVNAGYSSNDIYQQIKNVSDTQKRTDLLQWLRYENQ